MHSQLSKLHTTVHTLRSFIDTNIPELDSSGDPVPVALFYLCPAVGITNTITSHKRPRDQAITYAKSQRIRLAESFRSITSSAWQAGVDFQALKASVDFGARFANLTSNQLFVKDIIIGTLHQGWMEVQDLYRCIKADMAGIPVEFEIPVLLPQVMGIDEAFLGK